MILNFVSSFQNVYAKGEDGTGFYSPGGKDGKNVINGGGKGGKGDNGGSGFYSPGGKGGDVKKFLYISKE